jgi:hypothetical protein
MAVTYVTIDKSNYAWFGAAAVLSGLLGFAAIVWFDHLRKLHIAAIPLVGADGRPLLDIKRKVREENVVVGIERDMRDDARLALVEARKQRPGLSVRQFMSGFGERVNDPEALWDEILLAKISSSLTTTLMCVVLFAVMTVFWAAFMIEASSR